MPKESRSLSEAERGAFYALTEASPGSFPNTMVLVKRDQPHNGMSRSRRKEKKYKAVCQRSTQSRQRASSKTKSGCRRITSHAKMGKAKDQIEELPREYGMGFREKKKLGCRRKTPTRAMDRKGGILGPIGVNTHASKRWELGGAEKEK